MRGERFVLLGIAHVRSSWFQDVARWSTSAALPAEFVKCLTIEEVRARLGSGRPFSALLVDGHLPGVDRDLVALARDAGCTVLVVGATPGGRDWFALGASATLDADLDRADLLAALEQHAVPIGRGDGLAGSPARMVPTGATPGRLVAVTGPGGTGASVTAMALAQGLGADPRHGGLVLLADLALNADLAMLHDVGDVIPGVQELVDAHRGGLPSPQDVRSLTYAVPDRQYHLLLGLRRHRDWVSVRPKAFAAALDSLRRAHRIVVADVDPDVEGEVQCGSMDVEERNLMARSVTVGADVVVVVGLPGPKGVHRLVRLIDDLVRHGVAPGRIVPVVNRAPRGPRARSELTATVAELTHPSTGRRSTTPLVFLPERRRIDDLLNDAVRLPASLSAPIAGAVTALLERAGADTAPPRSEPEPVPVAPGSLGAWNDEDEGT